MFEEVEILLDGTVDDFTRVGISANSCIGVIGVVDHGPHVLRFAGSAAMDLGPDFDSQFGGGLGAFAYGLLDLFEGIFNWNTVFHLKSIGTETFTPGQPRLTASLACSIVPLIFSLTKSGSTAWNSKALPSSAISRPASSNLFLISPRSSSERVTSTLWAWVVRSSTPESPIWRISQ